MTEFYVEWSIHLKADSPEEAAKQALLIQRDPSRLATVFTVVGEGQTVQVDLEALEDEAGG